jgi:hypothetical protein
MAYAAEILKGQRSGSAQLYARGLSQASQQFQGQEVTADNALAMLSTLLGGGGAAAGQSAGLMISPTDGAYVTGNNIRFAWKASPGATRYWLIVRRVKDGSPRISKDLGNVLFSDEAGFADDSTQYKWTVGTGDNPEKDAAWCTFTNGPYVPPKQTAQAQQQADPGVGDIIGTLIRQAQGKGKQQAKAKGALDTIVGTVVSNSAMGGSYREQSGSLVANAVISAIQGMVNKK